MKQASPKNDFKNTKTTLQLIYIILKHFKHDKKLGP